MMHTPVTKTFWAALVALSCQPMLDLEDLPDHHDDDIPPLPMPLPPAENPPPIMPPLPPNQPGHPQLHVTWQLQK